VSSPTTPRAVLSSGGFHVDTRVVLPDNGGRARVRSLSLGQSNPPGALQRSHSGTEYGLLTISRHRSILALHQRSTGEAQPLPATAKVVADDEATGAPLVGVIAAPDPDSRDTEATCRRGSRPTFSQRFQRALRGAPGGVVGSCISGAPRVLGGIGATGLEAAGSWHARSAPLVLQHAWAGVERR